MRRLRNSSNFTQSETDLLIYLFGEIVKQKRQRPLENDWWELTRNLNAAGFSSVPRTVSEVRRKWKNMTYAARQCWSQIPNRVILSRCKGSAAAVAALPSRLVQTARVLQILDRQGYSRSPRCNFGNKNEKHDSNEVIDIKPNIQNLLSSQSISESMNIHMHNNVEEPTSSSHQNSSQIDDTNNVDYRVFNENSEDDDIHIVSVQSNNHSVPSISSNTTNTPYISISYSTSAPTMRHLDGNDQPQSSTRFQPSSFDNVEQLSKQYSPTQQLHSVPSFSHATAMTCIDSRPDYSHYSSRESHSPRVYPVHPLKLQQPKQWVTTDSAKKESLDDIALKKAAIEYDILCMKKERNALRLEKERVKLERLKFRFSREKRVSFHKARCLKQSTPQFNGVLSQTDILSSNDSHT